MDDSGYEHDVVHTNASGAIIALETKLGIGSTTAAGASTNHVLVKQADGDTEWAAAPSSTPTVITVADTTDTSCSVAVFESATGDLAPKTDGGLTYNAGTGTLTATALAGPLTGNVTGNASGTALTVTQAAQSAITSTGTLTGVTVSGTATIGVAVGQAVDLDRKTADYTLVLGDAGKVIEINSGSAENVTIPPNSSVAFPLGTQVVVVRLGAGDVTIVEGSGVTTRSDGDKAKIKAQYGSCVLIKHETNEWYILGNLA
tara:strand:- start:93 stop:869 length:777 start_codon:yes stop_codon:yes gene_type:complete